MHTVELLTHGLDLAERLGYRIRQEWLGGNGGGGCEFRGRKMLFIDLTLSPADQFEQVLDTLRGDRQATALPMPHELRELLKLRKTA